MTLGEYRTLNAAGTNTFVLPINAKADNDRLHFVPLWYPDGDYTVQGYAGDLWTPARYDERIYYLRPHNHQGVRLR